MQRRNVSAYLRDIFSRNSFAYDDDGDEDEEDDAGAFLRALPTVVLIRNQRTISRPIVITN